jgi:hypothetical protein
MEPLVTVLVDMLRSTLAWENQNRQSPPVAKSTTDVQWKYMRGSYTLNSHQKSQRIRGTYTLKAHQNKQRGESDD